MQLNSLSQLVSYQDNPVKKGIQKYRRPKDKADVFHKAFVVAILPCISKLFTELHIFKNTVKFPGQNCK